VSPDREQSIKPDEHGNIVREGYDKIARKYCEDRNLFENWSEINDFVKELPKNAIVLDIGCGAGVPVLKTMVEKGYTIKGIDFSKSMLELAKKNVPKADLVHGDVLKVELEDESFDGIISTYAVIHIHKSHHPALYQKIYNWLKPGGVMLVSTSRDENGEDYYSHDYYGVRMAWSHPSARESLQIIKNTGFEIIFDRTVTTGDETHLWILGRKPNTR